MLPSNPHAAPPWAARVLTTKWRVCVPPPQGSEHGLHGSNAPSQSTGHIMSVLQDCVSVSPALCVHSAPPPLDGVLMMKLRDAVPLGPHGSEHCPKAENAPTQLIGTGSGSGSGSGSCKVHPRDLLSSSGSKQVTPQMSAKVRPSASTEKRSDRSELQSRSK